MIRLLGSLSLAAGHGIELGGVCDVRPCVSDALSHVRGEVGQRRLKARTEA